METIPSTIEPLHNWAAIDASTSRFGTTIKKFVLGGLALACAFVATIGMVGITSSHFHHDHSRFLQQVADAQAVHVTLHPRIGSRLVTGNVSIHATLFPRTTNASDLNSTEFDARVFYEFADQLYNFTLVDNKGFWTVQDLKSREILTKDCLHKDNIPPIQTFQDALIHARIIDDVKSFDVKCEDGQLVEFMFANEPFVFCSRSNGAPVDKVHSQDFHMSLEFLTALSEGVPSRGFLRAPDGIDLAQCELLTTSQVPSSDSGRRLLDKHFQFVKRRVADVVHVAAGKRRLGEFDSSTCDSCPNGKKACLFVHGLGSRIYEGEVDSYTKYWGNMQVNAPCCSSVRYVHANTVDNPWYGANLTTEMCNAAKNVALNSSDPLQLEGLVLVTHSMGNLIASSAMIQKKCGLGASSKWIALSAPIIGSMSATTGLSICNQQENPFRLVLAEVGHCPAGEGLKSLAFKGSDASNADLDNKMNEAVQMFSQRVDSVMCGVSPTGLMTRHSISMKASAMFSNHESTENDGLVEIASCAAGLDLSLFSSSWRDNKYYKADVNHDDGKLHNGDGFWGDSRKPLKWFQCQF